MKSPAVNMYVAGLDVREIARQLRRPVVFVALELAKLPDAIVLAGARQRLANVGGTPAPFTAPVAQSAPSGPPDADDEVF